MFRHPILFQFREPPIALSLRVLLLQPLVLRRRLTETCLKDSRSLVVPLRNGELDTATQVRDRCLDVLKRILRHPFVGISIPELRDVR